MSSNMNPLLSLFPTVQLSDEQNLQLTLQPYQATSASLPSASLFTIAQDHQRVIPELGFHHKVNSYKIDHAGSSDQRKVYSSPSLHHQPMMMVDNTYATVKHKFALCKKEDGSESPNSENGSSAKWTSSKVRLVRRMNNSDCGINETLMNEPQAALKRTTQTVPHHDDHGQQNQRSRDITSYKNDHNANIRVCSDCNTTTTPLWRSGPRGPKSLCNACGIRQRKARRAREAAVLNGTVVTTNPLPSVKIKGQNKEKKSRTNIHVKAQYKKQFKPHIDSEYVPPHSQKKVINNCFKEFALSMSKKTAFGRVFPRDEEEAAILLMELSCGLLRG